MSWRPIPMKFLGTCIICNEKIEQGEMGLWAKGLGVKHEKCSQESDTKIEEIQIPEIIKKDGFSCNVEAMGDEEFLVEMEKKLSEEVTEYQNDKNPEELADILEVIFKIAKLKGISREELEKIRLDKVEKRGAFEDNLFLIDTDES